MVDKTIATNYEKFKNIILSETGKNARGIQEGIFQRPEKMHLTLGMLVLVDDEEVQRATEALVECHESIIKWLESNHAQYFQEVLQKFSVRKY